MNSLDVGSWHFTDLSIDGTGNDQNDEIDSLDLPKK